MLARSWETKSDSTMARPQDVNLSTTFSLAAALKLKYKHELFFYWLLTFHCKLLHVHQATLLKDFLLAEGETKVMFATNALGPPFAPLLCTFLASFSHSTHAACRDGSQFSALVPSLRSLFLATFEHMVPRCLFVCCLFFFGDIFHINTHT